MADYGMMMGFTSAIEWVEKNAPDQDGKPEVLARMRYERDKSIPVRPSIYKSKSWKTSEFCGRCGNAVEVHYKYCHNCGFAIDWRR